MAEKYIRDVFVYGNHFWIFYQAQTKVVQEKIEWVIGIIRSLQVIPERFFKHVEGSIGLYEIRIKVRTEICRIFCCFEQGNLIILLNGFQKKSEKTPPSEIKKALKLKDQYYESKKKK